MGSVATGRTVDPRFPFPSDVAPPDTGARVATTYYPGEDHRSHHGIQARNTGDINYAADGLDWEDVSTSPSLITYRDTQTVLREAASVKSSANLPDRPTLAQRIYDLTTMTVNQAAYQAAKVLATEAGNRAARAVIGPARPQAPLGAPAPGHGEL